MSSTSRTILPAMSLPHAEGNPRDEVATEAVLQAVEDFLAPIADDLIEPDAAVHGDEQCALVQAGRLGVGSQVRVDQVVPDAGDLCFRAATVQTEPAEDRGHHVA